MVLSAEIGSPLEIFSGLRSRPAIPSAPNQVCDHPPAPGAGTITANEIGPTGLCPGTDCQSAARGLVGWRPENTIAQIPDAGSGRSLKPLIGRA